MNLQLSGCNNNSSRPFEKSVPSRRRFASPRGGTQRAAAFNLFKFSILSKPKNFIRVPSESSSGPLGQRDVTASSKSDGFRV